MSTATHSPTIGHGSFGLRDSLRDFEEFIQQASSEKRVYAELRGGKVHHTWFTVTGTSTYVSDFSESFDGVMLDVVGIYTGEDSPTRVQRIQDCNATENTYFFDPALISSEPLAWDSDFDMDAADAWDQGGGQLYLHLPGGASPNDITVIVQVQFIFGVHDPDSASGPEVVPRLGPDMPVDGGIESWHDEVTPTYYTQYGVSAFGGVEITRESSTKREGFYSAKIVPGTSSGLDPGVFGGVYQESFVATTGGMYLVSVKYNTSWSEISLEGLPEFWSYPEARLGVSVAGGTFGWFEPDGLSIGAAQACKLRATNGEWRRAVFFIRSPSDVTNMLVFFGLANIGTDILSPGGHAVYFDDFHVYRVWGYDLVHRRLVGDALPHLTMSTDRITFGEQSVSTGSIVLANGVEEWDEEGFFERLLASYDFCSQSLYLRYGGAFDSGQEIIYDETKIRLAAVVEEFNGDPETVTLSLTNMRTILAAQQPSSKYDRFSFPGVSANDVNRPRPTILGTVAGVRGAMIYVQPDTDVYPGLAVYEINNPNTAPEPTLVCKLNPTAAWSYEDSEAADVKDPARRIALVANVDYVSGATYQSTGRITMKTNPGVIRIIGGENDALDWDKGGVIKEAFVPQGLYSWTSLLTAVTNAMIAADVAGYSATYGPLSPPSVATHLVNINAPAGIIIKLDTGANKHRSLWPTLGFDQNVDTASLTTHVATVQIPHNPDDQYIRWDVTGHGDTSTGKYTGTANALIQYPSDVAYFMIHKLVGIPNTQIDVQSFIDGRATSPQQLGVYIGGEGTSMSDVSLQDLVDIIEFSGYADIINDEKGRFKWQPRIDTVSGYSASIALKVWNRDVLSISWRRSLSDVVRKIQVNYAMDPVTGQAQVVEYENTQVPARFQRFDLLDVQTFFIKQADAQALGRQIGLLTSRPINHYTITVKGSLMNVLMASVIDITDVRRKLRDYSDQSEPYFLRVKSADIDFVTHTVEVTGYTMYFGLPPI